LTEFKVYSRVDLDGKHVAVLETDNPEYVNKVNKLKSPVFLLLKKTNLSCGCILASVVSSDANRLYLDRYKQEFLKIKPGDSVDAEEFNPAIAQQIVLKVPSDFRDQDIGRLVGKPITKNEKTALYTMSGETRLFVVSDTSPTGIVYIGSKTDVVTKKSESEEFSVSYSEIAGLDKEIKLIREIVEYPFRFPEVFERLGVSQSRGIILHGPPGTGKTMLAKALAKAVNAKVYQISGPEVFSKYVGESESNIRTIFEEAYKNAPALILIDEIDSLAPSRDKSYGETEKKVVATLLTCMDGLKQYKGVVVIGTTNRINSIDSALRREGRFGYDIHIGVPDYQGRKAILKLHTNRMPISTDFDLDQITERTVGFVGADIVALCREAAYNALRRTHPENIIEKGEISSDTDITIRQTDFENALTTIRPSALKEFLIEIPKVSWSDIGGLEEVKTLLVENIMYAITKREVFREFNLKPARGILLYGPPGTGKTLLAKAVAGQCGANFIAIKGPEIRSKWVGESEERIRFLFNKARESAPCVIFFDEIDALLPARGQDISGVTDAIVNQLLSEMDGIETTEGVFVIGATNRVELLDPAVLRPGRFDYKIEVPLPDEKARRSIFDVHLKSRPVSKDINYEELVNLSDTLSGAEIAEVCREGTWDALRETEFNPKKAVITMKHLQRALERLKQTKDKLKAKPPPSGLVT
jgi:transitional endoplasmic reticulum ATPase